MDKRFWAIVGIVIVGFFGFVLYNNHKNSSTTTTVQPTEHLTGDLQSKVTLDEYGDYQCPACESFSATTNAVRQKYASTVRFQFRNYPLTQLHPNALAAARAAEAASLQGKFWQYHDLLYQASNWSAWTVSSNPDTYFDQYATQLGLNLTQFKADAKSAKVNDIINADKAAFDKTGAQPATPTFFLNGQKLDNTSLLGSDGQPSVDAFSKLIDAALKSSGGN